MSTDATVEIALFDDHGQVSERHAVPPGRLATCFVEPEPGDRVVVTRFGVWQAGELQGVVPLGRRIPFTIRGSVTLRLPAVFTVLSDTIIAQAA